MIRVLVVDDQEMIRAGLRTLLGAADGIEVVTDVGDGFAALEVLEREAIDVVLLDIRMPGIDGIETTRRIREGHPPERVRIVILTTFEQDETVLAALRAGANGFLGKGVSPSELIAGIEEVVAGGGALSGAATAALIDHVASAPARVADAELAQRFERLTPREHDIVIAAAAGRDNESIAAELFLSPFTVKTHANRAMAKVGARDRSQLVAFAYRAGLVD